MSETHVQILLYTSYLHIIGGIETFVLGFIDILHEDYEIGVLCPRLPDPIAMKIKDKALLFNGKGLIKCDTLVMIRIMDPMPLNVKYEKSIRMCHAIKSNPAWYIKQDCDRIIHVSKASKKSFGSNGKVIYNPVIKREKKALFIVSATRIPALDKGKNAERMLNLAKKMNKHNIPFLWLNFSDAPLQNAPKGFINAGSYQDIQPYIARADYLVQLSDYEGFGYSVAEALANNTAVICTPFETTKELGVVDGENGYIIPFDLDFDVKKLLQVPEFDYTYDNERIRKNWLKVLRARTPRQDMSDFVVVKVRVQYNDIALDRSLPVGEIINMPRERAEYLEGRKLVIIMRDID